MSEVWTQHGKVRAREDDGVMEVVVDGLTTQAKYYKPLIYEFFRKAWRGSWWSAGRASASGGSGILNHGNTQNTRKAPPPFFRVFRGFLDF